MTETLPEATTAIALDETARAYVAALRDARAAEKRAKEATSRALAKVKETLGGAEYGVDADTGEALVRRSTIVSHRLDTKRLREELPEVAEAYLVESTTERVDLA